MKMTTKLSPLSTPTEKVLDYLRIVDCDLTHEVMLNTFTDNKKPVVKPTKSGDYFIIGSERLMC